MQQALAHEAAALDFDGEADHVASRLFEMPFGSPRRDIVWFAIEVQGGRFVGQCLLHHINQTARTCELGISIGDRDYMNQKYGRDAG